MTQRNRRRFYTVLWATDQKVHWTKKRKLIQAEAAEVQYPAEAFERSLITELGETNTYFVSSGGIFSTSTLLTKA
jgi:hypothetical protein